MCSHQNVKNKISFGTHIFCCGYLLRSRGEAEIVSFLLDNEIKFYYDKKYSFKENASKFRYDFYLPELNYYIEYIGLAKRNTKDSIVVNRYKERLLKKRDMICSNGISCLISSDVEYIKNKILEMIGEKKNQN